MSTKIEFKWEPGELESVTARKVENGFVVRVVALGNYCDYALADYPDTLQLMNECFCWDIAPGREEVVAEPVAQKFPASFLRFDMVDPELRAVFVESGVQWSPNAKQLDEHIEWLRVYGKFASEELAKWHAVLAELRATAASVARTTRLRAESLARSATPLGVASS